MPLKHHWEYEADRGKFEAWVAERRKKKLSCPTNMEYDANLHYYLDLVAAVAWAAWHEALKQERVPQI